MLFTLFVLLSFTTLTIQKVNAQTPISIPNIFTPNGDNFNEEFVLNANGTNVTDYEIKIYNRWGVLLFYAQSININWDGRTTAGVKVPEGVYYYVAKINGTDYKGFVTLLY